MKHATPEQRSAGLRIHALVFVIAMVLSLVVNLLIGPPYWVAWAALGWGIGLLSHWLAVRQSPGPSSLLHPPLRRGEPLE